MCDARPHSQMPAHLDPAWRVLQVSLATEQSSLATPRNAEEHFEMPEEGCASRQGAHGRVSNPHPRCPGPMSRPSIQRLLLAAPRAARNARLHAHNPRPRTRASWQMRPDGPGCEPGHIGRCNGCRAEGEPNTIGGGDDDCHRRD